MSLMNLQKLRRICHIDTDGNSAMTINLPPNDPLNHVEVRDSNGTPHYPQINSIHCSWLISQDLIIRYRTEYSSMFLGTSSISRFNTNLVYTFKTRLDEILTEHGFHSNHLPNVASPYNSEAFEAKYKTSWEFWEQIHHACYNDGASLRAALNFQGRINRGVYG